MERLTELKTGDSIPLSLLYEWAVKGHYCNGCYEIYTGSIDQFKQVMNPDKDNLIKIAKVTGSPYNSPFFHAYNKTGYTQFRLNGFVEFYNNFYNLGNKPVQVGWLEELEHVYFVVKDKEEQDRLLNRLFELGHKLNRGTELWSAFLEHWGITSKNYISGNWAKNNAFPSYTLMTVDELFPKQSININNTPLNTKTDGKSIIVSKPVARIQRGQRPEGNRVSGKTSRATVSGRHISHRTISI